VAANIQIVPKPRLLAGAEPPDGVPVKLLRVAKTAETFGAVMTTLVGEPSSQLKEWKDFAVNLERDFGTNDTALESAAGVAFNNSLQDSEVVPAGSPASSIQKDTLVEKMTQALKDGTFKAIPDGAGSVVKSTVVAEIETATEALNTAVLDAVVNPQTLVEVTLVPSPTPACLFHSTEAGTLHWYGDSSSASSAAVAGNNVTVLNALATAPTRTASSS
jgi:hypothetical protein